MAKKSIGVEKKMVSGSVKIGTRIPFELLEKGTVAVRMRFWTEFGTREYDEKNTIFLFDNEADYWKYMRSGVKKSGKMKNSDLTVSKTSVSYVPRYEAAALGMYDDNLEWEKMTLADDGKWVRTKLPSRKMFIHMGNKNIYVQRPRAK